MGVCANWMGCVCVRVGLYATLANSFPAQRHKFEMIALVGWRERERPGERRRWLADWMAGWMDGWMDRWVAS